MAKFILTSPDDKVRAGRHYHKGHIYQDGDVIEDDRDLEAMFQNKFIRVGDDTPVTPPRLAAPPDTPAAGAAPRTPVGEHTPPPAEAPAQPTKAKAKA